MKGFLKVAVATPKLNVCDVKANVAELKRLIDKAHERGVKLLLFPELCITGYSCGDMFAQTTLLKGAYKGLMELAECSEGKDMLVFLGLPYRYENSVYDVTAAVMDGEVLGIIPKCILSSTGDHEEERYFVRAPIGPAGGYTVPFGSGLVFSCDGGGADISVAVEMGNEAFYGTARMEALCSEGADVVVCPAALPEIYGKSAERESLLKSRSSELKCAYLFAAGSLGESTTDYVYSDQKLIAELGHTLASAKAFSGEELIVSDIDLMKITAERRACRYEATVGCKLCGGYAEHIYFEYDEPYSDKLDRKIPKSPFLEGVEDKDEMSREILEIQAHALVKRFSYARAERAVIGLSGGLDSTLTLLATRRAFELMGYPMENIICVTMPCFGTTDRTYNNACKLAKEVGAQLREVPISESVLKHFEDIGHDVNVRNSAYENAQARERTQVLMDIANDVNGIDIGTGDLSEEALGWCTFGGDHMANYSVNASIPKTMIRVVVSSIAEHERNESVKVVLKDILDTPVSPELLTSDEDGKMGQKTEDIVGPYELHDFFVWYMVKYGHPPKRIYELCCLAFEGEYDKAEIKKWMEVFYTRFFTQQFKRSMALDGPKATEVDLSPRGGLSMPSDASAALWLDEIKKL